MQALPPPPVPDALLHSVHFENVAPADLALPVAGPAHVIEMVPYQIVTRHAVEEVPSENGFFRPNAVYTKLCVVERHGKNGGVAVCPLKGYGITGGAGVELRTKAGNFLDFIWGNITLGQKASLYWAIGAGRFLQTAGLFLLGLYIGRKELFVTSETHLRFWVKILIIAAICFAPLYSLKEQIMASDNA